MVMRAQAAIRALLAEAGVEIGGQRAFDIQVHDQRFYTQVLARGSLGAGESFMSGWWDCAALDECFARLLALAIPARLRRSPKALAMALSHRLMNVQSRRRAYVIGQHHYDIGNDLFQCMLDQRMVYSCGYWVNATDLDQAQVAKLDLICRKLGLQPGMRLLDIGCGWGSLIRHAAEHYGVTAVGLTVSAEQAKLARKRCQGLPVEIRLSDYRTLDEPFDRIASVGMVEHVGWRNYRTYMQVVERCLRPGGLFLLHTIGANTSDKQTDPWISRYIFPNSHLPSLAQLSRASEGLLLLEELHNFGPDYDRTLLAWHGNFQQHWHELKHHYNERFRRMWQYYLLSCAGGFRARYLQLWQLLLAKPPRPKVVATVR
jgi:cyclopropane-fatty-acyl-phospholipid synthase